MMAALTRKVYCLRTFQGQWGITNQIVRNHWNRDWKPAKYPLAREDAEKAAKKYGIHPTEYEPYPDDGFGYGDYPKLPDKSADSRDPYYPWDFPEHKRNFNEPLHLQADMIGEDRFDCNLKPKYSMWLQLGTFLAVVLGGYALYEAIDGVQMVPPVLPKHYPRPGVTHFTFEPAE